MIILTLHRARLGQWGNFEQFFKISVLSLNKEFLDVMFNIVKFSYQSLCHDYIIFKILCTEAIQRC